MNLIKKLSQISLIILLSFLSSCEKEDLNEPISQKEDNQASKILLNQGVNQTVRVALVREEHCGNQKYKYSMYAMASNRVPYDREVYGILLSGQELIAAHTLIIPANQNTSNNKYVLNTASKNYGKVETRPYQVLVNGIPSNLFELIPVQQNINNCFTSNNSYSNCYIGIYPPDDPTTAANEGAGDQDHDGQCNSVDIDDNGNLIPDLWEPTNSL